MKKKCKQVKIVSYKMVFLVTWRTRGPSTRMHVDKTADEGRRTRTWTPVIKEIVGTSECSVSFPEIETLQQQLDLIMDSRKINSATRTAAPDQICTRNMCMTEAAWVIYNFILVSEKREMMLKISYFVFCRHSWEDSKGCDMYDL